MDDCWECGSADVVTQIATAKYMISTNDGDIKTVIVEVPVEHCCRCGTEFLGCEGEEAVDRAISRAFGCESGRRNYPGQVKRIYDENNFGV